MPTARKAAIIDDLTEKLDRMNAAALIEYRGLTVAEISDLRTQMRPRHIEIQVTKNTLLREAAHRNSMTEFDHLLEGPTAIAFIYDDEGAATKALTDYFGKARVGEIKSGLLKGGRPVTAEQFAKLADLPNRVTLLAQIAGLFNSPLSQLATLFNAPAQQFAYALAAFEERGGAGGSGIADAEAPEASPPDATAAPEVTAVAAEVTATAPDSGTPEVIAAEATAAPEVAAEATAAPEVVTQEVTAPEQVVVSDVHNPDPSQAPEEAGSADVAPVEPTPGLGGDSRDAGEVAAPEEGGSADTAPLP